MSAYELAFVGLAGSGLGTALGVPMVWPQARRSPDVRLLGAAVLVMSAIAALISARVAGLVPASAQVEHAINLLGFAAFSLLMLYLRHATGATLTPAAAAWCLFPAAVYLVVLAARSAVGGNTRVPFVWLLPVVLGFTVAGAVMLWRSDGVRRAALVPASWVLSFVVALNVAQIVRMEFAHVTLVRAIVPVVLSAGFLGVAVLFVWRTVTPESGAPRYEKSGLEESQAAALLSRLDEALSDDRRFARPDLTLAQLAAAANCTPHQVSEVLNRFTGVSFHDFINRRRVDDVKAQLRDPVNDRFTIEGIGASAGFGSRSALYAAFRRFEGMTPTAFRASQRQ
jgi:AraC-like DNA-binding protein